MPDDKTVEEVKAEVSELVNNVIGKINNIDSRTEKADVVADVLNSVVAGAELSKIEKAGILTYLVRKRVG